jgi:hypothetical protein
MSCDATATAELLEWVCTSTELPDSDTTVLCWDGETPFFCGYWDDHIGSWIDCTTGGTVFGVTHWADPEGPKHEPV